MGSVPISYHVRDSLPGGVPVVVFVNPAGVRIVYSRAAQIDDIAASLGLITKMWRECEKEMIYPVLYLAG